MARLTCNRERMRAAALQGFATATDLADYLVRRGIPFRDAHEIVGKAVALGVREGRDLSELSLAALQSFSPLIGPDVFAVLTLEGSLAARDHIGGTAPRQVRAALGRARERLGMAAGVAGASPTETPVS
jgi:argininosuccinate lyase